MLPNIRPPGPRPLPRNATADRTPSPPRDPDAASSSGRAALSTPPRSNPLRRDFLENTLGNKDLADLADMLDASSHPWALTGSSALLMWAHELGDPQAMAIVPHDADVVSTETGVDVLSRVRVPTGVEGERPKERGMCFNFTEALSVDLIASSARKKSFGVVPDDVHTLFGTPVMSLEVLLKSKMAAGRFAGEIGDTAKVMQSARHIELIRTLIARRDALRIASPVRPAQDRQRYLARTIGHLDANRDDAPSGRSPIVGRFGFGGAPEPAAERPRRAFRRLDFDAAPDRSPGGSPPH